MFQTKWRLLLGANQIHFLHQLQQYRFLIVESLIFLLR
jgi:hypothetical protein